MTGSVSSLATSFNKGQILLEHVMHPLRPPCVAPASRRLFSLDSMSLATTSSFATRRFLTKLRESTMVALRRQLDLTGSFSVDSSRVDICYRPLRIGWAIRTGDFNALRSAMRLSFALWGGRFNPIIVVDQEEQAQDLVDLFRLDMILPVGDSDVVKSFPKRFPYLFNPFFPEGLFIGGIGDWHSQVLDVHNALVHLQTKSQWPDGLRIYSWALDDPFAA